MEMSTREGMTSSNAPSLTSKTPSPRRPTSRPILDQTSPLRPLTFDSNIIYSPTKERRQSERGSHFYGTESESESGPSQSYSFPSPSATSKKEMNPHSSRPASPVSPVATIPPSLSNASVAQHRMSISGRPRRPSPLLHEIQPPTRRLSSHQLLLLTPFGGALPTAPASASGSGSGSVPPPVTTGMSSSYPATRSSLSHPYTGSDDDTRVGSGSMERLPSGVRANSSMSRTTSNIGVSGSMTRGSSSMGGPRIPDSSINARPGSSFSRRIGQDITPPLSHGQSSTGTGMNRTLSTSAPAPSLFRGTRHSSFAHHITPSPLSQPMTTIQSGSSGSGDAATSHNPSREPSRGLDKSPGLGTGGFRNLMETVPMLRSNSLPILTLRELEALRDKDGELGIARGGDWAWVSTDEDEFSYLPPATQQQEKEEYTPRRTQHMPLDSAFAFNDPFAPAGGQNNIFNPSQLEDHDPVSTSDDYKYSPTADSTRRMSDAPQTWSRGSNSSSSTSGSISGPSRNLARAAMRIRHSISTASGPTHVSPASRPIELPPAGQGQSSASHASSSTMSNESRTEASSSSGGSEDTIAPHSSSAQFFNSRASMSAIALESPKDVLSLLPESPHGTPLSVAARPRILRYKTSPARFTGLGLQIVVKASGSNVSGPPSGGPLSSGSVEGPASAGSGASRSSEDKGTSRRIRDSASGRYGAHDSRRFSQLSDTTTGPNDRRISGVSSTESASSGETRRRRSGAALGTWTSVDVVDALSSASFARRRPSVPVSIGSNSVSPRATRLPSISDSMGPDYTSGIAPDLTPDTESGYTSSSTSRTNITSIEAEYGVKRTPSASPGIMSSPIFTVQQVALRSELPGGNDFAIIEKGSRTGQSRNGMVDPERQFDRRNTAHGSDLPRVMQFSSLRGRGRYDSLDSAVPGSGPRIDSNRLEYGGEHYSEFGDFGTTETGSALGMETLTLYPRRGSLAVLTQTALGPWAVIPRFGGGGGDGGGDSTGDLILSTTTSTTTTIRGENKLEKHGLNVDCGNLGEESQSRWHERRGSWAEGWGFK